ncbi:tyrosine-protein phosphatase [Auritidibacter ignavus]|uniref:tyrosine-protein phosphatase n=1 Tax=Auritidibacter ignavus TaxID=678932 RepID=UPI003CC6B0A7
MAPWGDPNSIHNLRPLPGVTSTAKGPAKIYRSSVPGKLQLSAPELCAVDGIGTVIDLREPEEILQRPDTLPEHVGYINIPLYRGPVPRDEPILQVYSRLITQRGAQLVCVLKAVTMALDDGVLIHCTAGKDRTGLVAALVLSVAGITGTSLLPIMPAVLTSYRTVTTHKSLPRCRVNGIPRLKNSLRPSDCIPSAPPQR